MADAGQTASDSVGVFTDFLNYLNSGRAAKSISDANIAAEHGVLGATSDAQSRIDSTLGDWNTNVRQAGDMSNAQINEAKDWANVGINQGAGNANNTLQGLLDQQTANYQPYVQAGQKGVSALSDYALNKPAFSFNYGDYANDPAMQFQMDQGTKAITNAASVGGFGGGTLKDLTKYGQGLASTYYNDAFNRAQQTYNTNQNTTLANLQALTGAGLQGTQDYQGAAQNLGGAQAANTMGAGVATGANTMAAGQTTANTTKSLSEFLAALNLQGNTTAGQMGMQGATTAGNFAVNAGMANASGIMGQGAAIGNGLSDLTSLIKGL